MLNVLEKRLKIPSPRSLPLYLKVEPTPICKMKCPGCTHSSLNHKIYHRNMQMNVDDFKKVISPLSSSLLGISLSLYGEPLMHKNISSIIQCAHDKNISVSFPTNLSVKLDEQSINLLVTSGLDSILVSLDGASEETYSKYRVGGNFSLVLDNVKFISKAKQKFSSKRPKLIWKFIVFDHNRHEMDVVKEKYKEFGFDNYEFQQNAQSDNYHKAKKAYMTNLRKAGKGCYWLWHAMIIGWDGEVFPCCNGLHFDIGNAISEDIKVIWRSQKYRELRQGFSNKKSHPELNKICKMCTGY